MIKISDFGRENFDLIVIEVEECQIRHLFQDFWLEDGYSVFESVEDAEMA